MHLTSDDIRNGKIVLNKQISKPATKNAKSNRKDYAGD